MSTEPRRIKKVVRRYNNPLLTQDEVKNSFTPTLTGHTGGKPQRTLAYTLTKARIIAGCVTLPQLAAERGIQAQLARLWVKAAGIKKPGDRWVWKADSKALQRVRKALGLEP